MKRKIILFVAALFAASAMNADPSGIMIGRDVTTTKPQGSVVVEKDQMTIKVPQGVTIKNSFYVKKGAVFEIK